MAYEQRDNSGSLFKNDKKGNDRAPDYRGPAMVNGETVEMSAWIQKSATGMTYMSLQFKEPYQKQDQQPRQESRKPSHDAVKARQLPPQRTAPARSNAGGFDDMDSDVPF